MERRICPNCGTPQQWELWQQCVCGHDFGPPEPKSLTPAELAGARIIWLNAVSPKEAIRTIRVRMLWSWALYLWTLATLFWADGKPTVGFFLVLWALYVLRRDIPTRAAPGGPWAPIAVLSAVMIATALIILPERILPFIFILPLGLLSLYVLFAEVKQFRSPLRFFSQEDLAKLKVWQ